MVEGVARSAEGGAFDSESTRLADPTSGACLSLVFAKFITGNCDIFHTICTYGAVEVDRTHAVVDGVTRDRDIFCGVPPVFVNHNSCIARVAGDRVGV